MPTQYNRFNYKTMEDFMSAKWKGLTGEICDISCPRSGKYAG